MTVKRLKTLGLAVLPAIALAACSASGLVANGEDSVTLEPGEVKVYSFAAEESMMVSWSHEGDADTALACQGPRPDPMAFPLPNCAGVYQSDGTGIVSGGNYAEGLHGAGVSFEPENGKIVVALKNISKVPLDLTIEAKPVGE